MLAPLVLRASVAPASRLVTTRSVRLAPTLSHLSRSFFAGTALKQEAAASSLAGAKPRTSKAPSSSTKKPVKAKKPKKEVLPKLKSWEKRGPDGKLLPLPRATKPKRTNGFSIFIAQRAKELRNDPSLLGANNKFDVTKLAATVGQQWRSMGEAEKKNFMDQADQANVQYERDMEQWRSNLTSEDIKRENSYIQAQRKKGKTGTALLRDPTRPKQPRSAFLAFFLAYRAQNSDLASLTLGEQSKRASTAWKQLSGDEKEKYEREAATDRERYQSELAAWKSSARS